MITLALTTSSPRGGVALLDNETLLAQRDYDDERAHAERIFIEFNHLLAETQIARNAIDALACDIGPGSFTGTRVGLASAKGIALALDKPLWPVHSLKAMAAAAFAHADTSVHTLVAAMDAKRGELFFASYGKDLQPQQPPQHLPLDKAQSHWQALATANTAFCGLMNLPAPHIRHPDCNLPAAAWIGRLAAQALALDEPAPDLALIEPLYVRAPDATPNLPPSPVDWQKFR